MDTNNAISFGSLVISASALCLSIYATCRTRKLEKLQIKSVSAELDASKKADVRAKIIKVGSNRYYLKIYNCGKCSARDVNILFPCGNDIVAVSELHDKLPLKKLEPQGGIELIAALHMGTKAKRDLCIMWSDDYAENQTKEVELCIT